VSPLAWVLLGVSVAWVVAGLVIAVIVGKTAKARDAQKPSQSEPEPVAQPRRMDIEVLRDILRDAGQDGTR
jgi:hypothetical protein